jgi:hypothetical protein
VAEHRVTYDEVVMGMEGVTAALKEVSLSLKDMNLKWEWAPLGDSIPEKPRMKVTDNRSWDRPGYAGFWRDKPYWMTYGEAAYWDNVAEQLGRQHWLGEVKARLGLVTSEAGCASIRPKPELGDEWDEFKARWAAA